MATNKAVMIPALEYASSIWSPLVSSTSIIELQVMQNAALRTATGCTQDTNLQHLHGETLILPIHEHPQLYGSHYKQKTQHPSHLLHKHITDFNTPRLKHYLSTTNTTQQTFLKTPTQSLQTYNKHVPYTYICFSRLLATKTQYKIMRTPPPHIISSEEILSRFTRCSLAQLSTNKSPFLIKSYLHKVDAKSHPSPLCPLCYTHIHNTYHLFNFTLIRTMLLPMDLWRDPTGVTALLARLTEKLAGGPQAGRSDTPLARVKGVGRHQQQHVQIDILIY